MSQLTHVKLPDSTAFIPAPIDEGISKHELEILSDITRIVTTAAELPEVLQHVVETFTHLLHADETTITLFNDDYTQLQVTAHYSIHETDSLITGRIVPVPTNDRSLPVIFSGRSIIIPNAQTDPITAPRHHAYKQRGWHCVIRIPLQARGTIIGAISGFSKNPSHIFSTRNVQLAEMAATQISGVIANAQLFTQSQEIRQALKNANQQLADQVKQLDAFTHTVAHDIKTPLNLIQGFAQQLAENSYPPEKQEQFRQAIVRSSKKAQDIVNSLLLLAHINKAEDAPLELISMAPIIDQALSQLEPIINGQQATIKLNPTWPLSIGYAPWIEEIWANYLSNALKYGGETTHIELGASSLEDNFIRFWVKDNGPGISQHDQASLFESFHQLDTRSQGHGLGLSIVKQIVSKLGGRAGVQSVLGEGCTFYFDLPEA